MFYDKKQIFSHNSRKLKILFEAITGFMNYYNSYEKLFPVDLRKKALYYYFNNVNRNP